MRSIDRIVVMHDGFIQQVDMPQNLYDIRASYEEKSVVVGIRPEYLHLELVYMDQPTTGDYRLAQL